MNIPPLVKRFLFVVACIAVVKIVVPLIPLPDNIKRYITI